MTKIVKILNKIKNSENSQKYGFIKNDYILN